MDPAVLDAAIKKLAMHDLDLFLEERRLYRRLVAECQHRGVPEPKRPTRYAEALQRMRAARPIAPARATSRPIENWSLAPPRLQPGRIFRPSTGSVLNVY